MTDEAYRIPPDPNSPTPDSSDRPPFDSPQASSADPQDAVEPNGLEPETEDSEEITKPFSPEKIQVRTKPILVQQILLRIRHNEIDLQPEFQRLAGVWDSQRQGRLIESLLLRIPIPVFYFAADENDRWSVVDGVQRISTIHRFTENNFRSRAWNTCNTSRAMSVGLARRSHDELES